MQPVRAVLSLQTLAPPAALGVLAGAVHLPSVVTGAGEIRSNVVSSQGVHDRYGGVVPEIASRHHLELVNAVVDDALQRADTTLDDVETVARESGGAGAADAGASAETTAKRRRPDVPAPVMGLL